ncbi:MAG: 30S ribosomal protein S7 [Candidatus Margulisbacteria bacterium GWF2_35_9]|nr:MAG: 30S ribosomal protein S7 [Candidatus Margulisbacteria bacterium GWF2_35_9]
MSRRRRSVERKKSVDVKFNSIIATKFINRLMLDGKRSTAETIFYGALEMISDMKKEEDAFKVFNDAIKNTSPAMEVKSRRVGGATYQVPMEVRKKRSLSLAMRWLVQYSRERAGKSMEEKLAKELLDASGMVGASVKKKDDMHRMAEANKAFAHFRW